MPISEEILTSVSLDGIEFSANAVPKTVEQLANKYGYSIVPPSSQSAYEAVKAADDLIAELDKTNG